MNKVFPLFCLLFLIFSLIYGQLPQKTGKVIHDPLLWKRKLRLTKLQCEEISQINTLFYQLLYSADSLDSNSRLGIDELYFLIHARSEQIWRVFSDRQKRKWSKLSVSFEKCRYFKDLLNRLQSEPPEPLLAESNHKIENHYTFAQYNPSIKSNYRSVQS